MESNKVINFMGTRLIATLFSALLLLGSVGSLVVNGLNFGLDFTGGLQVEVEYEHKADLEQIRSTLSEAGYVNVVVVNFGSDEDVLIRMQLDFKDGIGEEVLRHLTAVEEGEITLKRVEYVGPQVGEELRDQGGIGMLFALVVVMAYVAMRFQWKFAVAAVAALAHDVIIVLGFFSILGVGFDLSVLAAILAVVGYSLNDTIVVFDRIRENFPVLRKTESVDVVNVSLTQTLDRTLVTSGTTLIVLVVLYMYGGELLSGFSSALLVGIVIGTYSSIYVASNLLLGLNIVKEDLMPPVKEGAEVDEMP
ncbi:protein translocase subunit SecF [Simiduia agarivorans]|uniref:Protein-export membrane protein SecF n=1 Tax=Simiduia agarivorans (strain DSM 21679 / JCM 13881 / BCRC 17597 / SA1) TaxID=1117647 RepID=K4KJJ3_SIMAS|nr:protein translocase subunit SecF [Simiduia agarivorans]AFU98163.1 protein-export membrane protein SecF [Simiduia agarivorans SA1 = DSM 21679]